MAAIRQNSSDGMAEYLKQVNSKLAKAMAVTGCTDLEKMGTTAIHRLQETHCTANGKKQFGRGIQDEPEQCAYIEV